MIVCFLLTNFFLRFSSGGEGSRTPKSVSEKILQGEKNPGVTDSARADTGRNVSQKSS